eukprot:364259-Chlamydomonas_euryale.AAC.11
MPARCMQPGCRCACPCACAPTRLRSQRSMPRLRWRQRSHAASSVRALLLRVDRAWAKAWHATGLKWQAACMDCPAPARLQRCLIRIAGRRRTGMRAGVGTAVDMPAGCVDCVSACRQLLRQKLVMGGRACVVGGEPGS